MKKELTDLFKGSEISEDLNKSDNSLLITNLTPHLMLMI